MQAAPDPVLCRLVAAVDRATADLRAYIERPVADPDSDLVALRDAEVEFSRSNKQLRRWVKDEGLGVEIDGKLFLKRSLVLQYKLV